MSKPLQISFVNKSVIQNIPAVVILELDSLPHSNTAIAWTVIKNLSQGWSHTISYSYDDLEISVIDADGNESPRLKASPGNTFTYLFDELGEHLEIAQDTKPDQNPAEVRLRNDANTGPITGNFYRCGKLLATTGEILPGQMCARYFSHSIMIGIVSQIEEGQHISAAALAEINTEINLLGLTGIPKITITGGPGKDSSPYVFTMVQ